MRRDKIELALIHAAAFVELSKRILQHEEIENTKWEKILRYSSIDLSKVLLEMRRNK